MELPDLTQVASTITTVGGAVGGYAVAWLRERRKTKLLADKTELDRDQRVQQRLDADAQAIADSSADLRRQVELELARLRAKCESYERQVDALREERADLRDQLAKVKTRLALALEDKDSEP